MKNHNNTPSHKIQSKDTQFKLVFNALFEKPRTMKEVFVCTGVMREFVCWYCRSLRLAGRLYFTRKRKCTVTGRIVMELTTNEAFAPEFPKQLKLF